MSNTENECSTANRNGTTNAERRNHHAPLRTLVHLTNDHHPPCPSTKPGIKTCTQDIIDQAQKENQPTSRIIDAKVHPKNYFPKKISASLPSLPPLATTRPNSNTGNQNSSNTGSTPNKSHLHYGMSFTTESSPQQPYEKNGVIQVLRYGETIPSFFQINENSSDEYRNLCNTIDSMHSSLEQKASAWRRLLEIRCQALSDTGIGPTAAATETRKDLLRLHRRATSYFTSVISSLPQKDDTKVTALSHLLRQDLLHIWLSYVTVQAKYCHDHHDTARTTIRHVQNQSYLMPQGATVHRDAVFYRTWSMVEESSHDNYATAESILREGIHHRAEPIIELHDALRIIQRKRTISSTTTSPKHRFESVSSTNCPSASPKRMRMDSIPPALNVNSTVALSDCAPSQDSNMSLDTVTEAGNEAITDSTKGTSVELADLTPIPRNVPIVASATEHSHENGIIDSIPVLQHRLKGSDPSATLRQSTATVGPMSDERTGVVSITKNTISSTAGARSTELVVPNILSTKPLKPSLLLSSNQKSNTRKLSSSATFKRPPLQFKTFGLGKAERIDPSQSILESDSDDDECKNDKNQKSKKQNESPLLATGSESTHKTPPTKKPKISKMDLDYMWNWDPDKRLNITSASPATSNSIVDDDAKPQHLPQNRSAALSSVPGSAGAPHGTPSVSLSSSSSNSTASSSRSTHPPPTTSANSAHKGAIQTPPIDAPAKVSSDDDFKHAVDKPLSAMTAIQEPTRNVSTPKDNVHDSEKNLSRVNSEFLPLIQESNMIRVNQEPYVKLGVIGKGGSCKVYRALSKDCSVLAIKRVKTEDLDRKAIDGYANEIALLKRLRGNPSIIQLHDSEVDMTRQVILLVMEAGEADLNHVLQRQSIGQGTGIERSLNMNFIRLTWQQMLKAVHSIHEQRIIHGDLKPANFLFVRGSLKLIDFGIAKAIQNDNTNNIYRENQIGTLNYMSPEAICDSGTSSLGQRMKCGRVSFG